MFFLNNFIYFNSGLFIGNNPNAKQVSGLGFGVAHSEANQNINNFRFVFGLNKKDELEKKRERGSVIKNLYPNTKGNRVFNEVINNHKDGE